MIQEVKDLRISSNSGTASLERNEHGRAALGLGRYCEWNPLAGLVRDALINLSEELRHVPLALSDEVNISVKANILGERKDWVNVTAVADMEVGDDQRVAIHGQNVRCESCYFSMNGPDGLTCYCPIWDGEQSVLRMRARWQLGPTSAPCEWYVWDTVTQLGQAKDAAYRIEPKKGYVLEEEQ